MTKRIRKALPHALARSSVRSGDISKCGEMIGVESVTKSEQEHRAKCEPGIRVHYEDTCELTFTS